MSEDQTRRGTVPCVVCGRPEFCHVLNSPEGPIVLCEFYDGRGRLHAAREAYQHEQYRQGVLKGYSVGRAAAAEARE